MKTFIIKALSITVFLGLTIMSVSGQPLPTQHGGGAGVWVGGSAAIDGGWGIILLLTSLYLFNKSSFISRMKLYFNKGK